MMQLGSLRTAASDCKLPCPDPAGALLYVEGSADIQDLRQDLLREAGHGSPFLTVMQPQKTGGRGSSLPPAL